LPKGKDDAFVGVGKLAKKWTGFGKRSQGNVNMGAQGGKLVKDFATLNQTSK